MQTREDASPDRDDATGLSEDLEAADALLQPEKRSPTAQRKHGALMQSAGALDQEEYRSLPVEPPKPTARRKPKQVAPHRRLENEPGTPS
jgi:hypothetical protein